MVNSATSYNWSVPSGANIAFGQGTNSILVNFSSTPGNISVTAVNACGSSSASVLAITMPSAAPASPGVIHGNATFTPNQSGVLYYVAPVSNANSYTWSVPSDATITSGQGTDSIKVTFGTASGNVCVTATNCVGTSSSCTTVHNSCYNSGAQTFNYTGSQQMFTVPCGVPWVSIAVFGAQGGNSYGGLGGSATGTLAVSIGTVLYVFVGGQNGYNGGGTGYNGSNGGGMSDVRVGGTSINNWVIVAGGGGGAPNNSPGGAGGAGSICANGAGGGGGTLSNQLAGSGTCTTGGNCGAASGNSAGGGGGGGLTSGGVGSTNQGYTGGTGTKGQGGNYAVSATCAPYLEAAGGGGGYYGGGGTGNGFCQTAGAGGGGLIMGY